MAHQFGCEHQRHQQHHRHVEPHIRQQPTHEGRVDAEHQRAVTLPLVYQRHHRTTVSGIARNVPRHRAVGEHDGAVGVDRGDEGQLRIVLPQLAHRLVDAVERTEGETGAARPIDQTRQTTAESGRLVRRLRYQLLAEGTLRFEAEDRHRQHQRQQTGGRQRPAWAAPAPCQPADGDHRTERGETEADGCCADQPAIGDGHRGREFALGVMEAEVTDHQAVAGAQTDPGDRTVVAGDGPWQFVGDLRHAPQLAGHQRTDAIRARTRDDAAFFIEHVDAIEQRLAASVALEQGRQRVEFGKAEAAPLGTLDTAREFPRGRHHARLDDLGQALLQLRAGQHGGHQRAEKADHQRDCQQSPDAGPGRRRIGVWGHRDHRTI